MGKLRPTGQPHVRTEYTYFEFYVEVILSIRLELSRFYSTRFIRNRIFNDKMYVK